MSRGAPAGDLCLLSYKGPVHRRNYPRQSVWTASSTPLSASRERAFPRGDSSSVAVLGVPAKRQGVDPLPSSWNLTSCGVVHRCHEVPAG